MAYKLPVDHTIRIHLLEEAKFPLADPNDERTVWVSDRYARVFYGSNNENAGRQADVMQRVHHLVKLGWKITEVLDNGVPTNGTMVIPGHGIIEFPMTEAA